MLRIVCYCFKAGLHMCGVAALLGTTMERALSTGVNLIAIYIPDM